MPNEKPARAPYFLTAGDDFVEQFSWELGPTEAEVVPVTLVGEAWRFTVRNGLTDAVLLELSSTVSPGGITLDADGVVGRVRAFAPGSGTAVWPVTVGQCDPTPHKFDWERTDAAGVVSTPWVGDFHVGEGQSR